MLAGDANCEIRACYLETNNENDCCGCEACASVCPTSAIRMVEDEEGFRYPVVDGEACIKCGRCTRACSLPENRFRPANGQRGFGGSIKDSEILADSTSGGAFTAIASAFLGEGGTVFGVEASEVYKARHAFAKCGAELGRFRGSKYVQSEVGNAYSDATGLLRAGERVLFSGTPCQIAALYGALGKLADSPNLLTIEVICEGVPSPKLVEKLLAHVSTRHLGGEPVTAMRYRDKWSANYVRSGKWDYQTMGFESEHNGARKRWIVDRWFNPFWSIWLQHLVSRPSCAACPFARRERVADISLGDLWGVHLYCPDLYNEDHGCSLVVCNTEKGIAAFEAAAPAMSYRELDMSDVVRYQGPMRKPTGVDPRRSKCMGDLCSPMEYREFARKWAKKPTLKLLISKYIWGTNKQVCAKANRKNRGK